MKTYPVLTSKEAQKHLSEIKNKHNKMLEDLDMHNQRVLMEKKENEQKQAEKEVERKANDEKAKAEKANQQKADREYSLKLKEHNLKKRALLAND